MMVLQSKLDNAKKTGTVGGPEKILDEADKKVLEIIGDYSHPVLSGVDVQETYTPLSPSSSSEPISDQESKEINSNVNCSWSTPRQNESPKKRAAPTQGTSLLNSKRRIVGVNFSNQEIPALETKENLKMCLLKKEITYKDILIESASLDLYKKKLECLKLERELNVSHSTITLPIVLSEATIL